MSCKCCCALFSLLLIIGIGITAYFFRDQITQEYYKIRSVKNSYEDDINELESTSTRIITTTTTNLRESYSNESDDSDDDINSDENDEEITSTTTTTTMRPLTTKRGSTTTTKRPQTSTHGSFTVTLVEGSGSGSGPDNIQKRPIDDDGTEDNDEDYYA